MRKIFRKFVLFGLVAVLAFGAVAFAVGCDRNCETLGYTVSFRHLKLSLSVDDTNPIAGEPFQIYVSLEHLDDNLNDDIVQVSVAGGVIFKLDYPEREPIDAPYPTWMDFPSGSIVSKVLTHDFMAGTHWIGVNVVFRIYCEATSVFSQHNLHLTSSTFTIV